MTVKIYIYKLYYTSASEMQYNKNLDGFLLGNLTICKNILAEEWRKKVSL